MTEKVLFVDDDARILNAFKRRLYKKYTFHTAVGAEEGFETLKKHGPFAVVISDQQMPGMDGITFLKKVMDDYPITVRMMLTGNADRATALNSVNESHVFRFLNKPCSLEQLTTSIDDAVSQHKLLRTEKELLENTLAGSVKLLVDILALRDPHAVHAVGPMRKAARKFARYLGHNRTWELDMAVMLSSIGDIALPAQVRNKLASNEPLNEVEKEIYKSSPGLARDLLRNIPRLQPIAEAIYYQNKGFDGSGYPQDNAVAKDIPLNARILAIVKNMLLLSGGQAPNDQTFIQLAEQGVQYDPQLLEAAHKCFLNIEVQEVSMEEEEREVTISQLLPGDFLLENLETETGEMALAANNEITEAMLAKIRQYHKLNSLKEPVSIRRTDEKSKEDQSAA